MKSILLFFLLFLSLNCLAQFNWQELPQHNLGSVQIMHVTMDGIIIGKKSVPNEYVISKDVNNKKADKHDTYRLQPTLRKTI